MRGLIAILVGQCLLIGGATTNLAYQGWANRSIMKAQLDYHIKEKKKEIDRLECTDSVVAVYPGKPLSKNGWLSCDDDQDMHKEYFKPQNDQMPYMIVSCVCRRDETSDTGI